MQSDPDTAFHKDTNCTDYLLSVVEIVIGGDGKVEKFGQGFLGRLLSSIPGCLSGDRCGGHCSLRDSLRRRCCLRLGCHGLQFQFRLRFGYRFFGCDRYSHSGTRQRQVASVLPFAGLDQRGKNGRGNRDAIERNFFPLSGTERCHAQLRNVFATDSGQGRGSCSAAMVIEIVELVVYAKHKFIVSARGVDQTTGVKNGIIQAALYKILLRPAFPQEDIPVSFFPLAVGNFAHCVDKIVGIGYTHGRNQHHVGNPQSLGQIDLGLLAEVVDLFGIPSVFPSKPHRPNVHDGFSSHGPKGSQDQHGRQGSLSDSRNGRGANDHSVHLFETVVAVAAAVLFV
mmetsp:Transcript_10377/g.30343  ORF Transcript_10377/g.30343 Transcript_10377/m.30343 type:complete len:340 (+) Transcript_10377:807-1826(+)